MMVFGVAALTVCPLTLNGVHACPCRMAGHGCRPRGLRAFSRVRSFCMRALPGSILVFHEGTPEMGHGRKGVAPVVPKPALSFSTCFLPSFRPHIAYRGRPPEACSKRLSRVRLPPTRCARLVRFASREPTTLQSRSPSLSVSSSSASSSFSSSSYHYSSFSSSSGQEGGGPPPPPHTRRSFSLFFFFSALGSPPRRRNPAATAKWVCVQLVQLALGPHWFQQSPSQKTSVPLS